MSLTLRSAPCSNSHRAIASFAAGHRQRASVTLSGAPLELTEIADAYTSMTTGIMHDEAKLEDTIHQKEVLLREVHAWRVEGFGAHADVGIAAEGKHSGTLARSGRACAVATGSRPIDANHSCVSARLVCARGST